jgi:hypothetical protein
MHDGAPAHHSRAVRGVLCDAYPDRWVGRGGLPACMMVLRHTIAVLCEVFSVTPILTMGR